MKNSDRPQAIRALATRPEALSSRPFGVNPVFVPARYALTFAVARRAAIEIQPRFTRSLPTKIQVTLYGCLAPGQCVMPFSISRAARRRGRRLRPLAVFDP